MDFDDRVRHVIEIADRSPSRPPRAPEAYYMGLLYGPVVAGIFYLSVGRVFPQLDSGSVENIAAFAWGAVILLNYLVVRYRIRRWRSALELECRRQRWHSEDSSFGGETCPCQVAALSEERRQIHRT